jgi:2'-5' RNA ligase
MRAFVAIRVPEHPALEACFSALSRLGGSVKPVPTGSMHLTLKFIGEIAVPAGDLVASMDSAAAPHIPFVLRPSGAGAFPGWSRPNVAWIGFDDGDALRSLALSVENALYSDLSIPLDTRPFSAHLTLARLKGPCDVRAVRAAAEACASALASDGYTVPVGSISLMSSTLTPRGPVYDEVGRAPLRG